MTVQPLSLSALGGATANGASTLAPGGAVAVSQNGRYVVLQSTATNLVAGQVDTNAAPDVFLYDRELGTTTLVSRSGADPLAAANGASGNATISGDGRYVAFRSTATNLVAGQDDTNGTGDVFLFDRVAGTVALVSRSSPAPLAAANGTSFAPAISAGGNFIVFASAATNLVAGQADVNGAVDLFVYDRAAGTNTLVSRNSASATATGNGASDSASVSADGHYIAFRSLATNLVAGVTDENGNADVFVYDRVAGTTALVSHNAESPTTAAFSQSDGPVISADGNSIAFTSFAPDLVADLIDDNLSLDVFVYDRATGTNALVSHNAADPLAAGDNYSDSPILSADGRYVAFRSAAADLVAGQTDANGDADVFLHDRATGTTTLVSRSAGSSNTAGNFFSGPPAVSHDGRLVTFASRATNLVGGLSDTNATLDVFVYDHAAGTIRLASHASASGAETGNGLSERPSLSANGGVLVFQSGASNLAAGDSNSAADVFAFTVMNAPTLTADGVLPAVDESDFGPAGAAIADLFSGLFLDSDPGSSFEGVLVVGNAADPETVGTWQYSTNGGGGWFDIGQVGNGPTALALSAGTLVRFLPVAHYFGTPGSVTVRAVDDSYSGAFTTTSGSTENRVHLDAGGSAAVFGNARSVHTTVRPVANRPSVTSATTKEDRQNTSGLVIKRHAADGSEVRFFKITAIRGGTLYLNDGATPVRDGDFITADQGGAGLKFTPAANANTAAGDSFGFVVQASLDNAGGGMSPGATATVTVTAVNDAPGFAAGSDQAAPEDGGAQTVSGWATNFSAGPVDEAGQTVVEFLVTNDNPGLFSVQPAVSPNGTLTYTPAPDANGVARVTVRLRDSGGTADGGSDTSEPQSFLITVTPVSDVPVARDDAVSAAEDESLSIDVLANDTDVDGDALTLSAYEQGSHGAVTLAADGRLVYTPRLNFHGTDRFRYTVSDGHGGTATATVTVTVTPVNDAPVTTVPATRVMYRNGTLAFTAATQVKVSDVDSGAAKLKAVLVASTGTLRLASTPAGLSVAGAGTATLTLTGTLAALNSGLAVLTYKPPTGFVGTATITVTTNDQGSTGAGGAKSGVGAFKISVLNRTPVRSSQFWTTSVYTARMNTALAVPTPSGLVRSFTDPDGDPLTFKLVTRPTRGTLTLYSTGAFRYVPATNFKGTVTFTVQAFDGKAYSSISTITIKVV